MEFDGKTNIYDFMGKVSQFKIPMNHPYHMIRVRLKQRQTLERTQEGAEQVQKFIENNACHSLILNAKSMYTRELDFVNLLKEKLKGFDYEFHSRKALEVDQAENQFTKERKK